MKALCIYVAAGKGHFVPAKAVSASLEKQGVETDLVEFFDFLEIRKTGWLNLKYWRFALRLPKAERLISSRNDSDKRLKKIVVSVFQKSLSRRIKEKLEEIKPDFIFTTHPYASTLFSTFVKKENKKIPVYYFATDVFLVPRWAISNDLRKILVSSEEGKNSAVALGQREETVEIVPFPLQKKIAESKIYTKEEARIILNLDPRLFTIQINLGGEGIGSISLLKSLSKLTTSFQSVIIGKIDALKSEEVEYLLDIGVNVTAPGFVENVNEYLYASDVVIGRAGVNTICEAIYAKRPFMVTDTVYTVTAAVDYIEKHKIGWNFEGKKEELIKKIVELIEKPELLREIEENFSTLNFSFSSDEVASFLISDCNMYKKENDLVFEN